MERPSDQNCSRCDIYKNDYTLRRNYNHHSSIGRPLVSIGLTGALSVRSVNMGKRKFKHVQVESSTKAGYSRQRPEEPMSDLQDAAQHGHRTALPQCQARRLGPACALA